MDLFSTPWPEGPGPLPAPSGESAPGSHPPMWAVRSATMPPSSTDPESSGPGLRHIGHWVAGRAAPGTSGRTAPVYDPARGVQTGEVALASAAEVDAVVASAVGASDEWGSSSLTRRASLLFRLRELLDASRDELAAAVTREHGKVLEDAKGEVARGIENVEFACGIPNLLKGSSNSEISTGIDIRTVLEPLGVVAGITPFNFPIMVPLWMMANAIACGNCFVLKPSEKDPSVSLVLAESCSGPGSPTASSASCRATARRSRRCWPTPTWRRSPSWAARRWRVTSTRPGRVTASGSRRSVAQRTTWWCSPTPTSRPPPTPRCPLPTGRPANGAWRSRWSLPSVRWPIR